MDLNQARAYAPVDVVFRGVQALRTRMTADHMGGHGVTTSVRTAEHHGHTIESATRYEIRIDGRRVAIPLHVDNGGRVTCHAVPNYQSVSGVDVVKKVIDVYPDSFQEDGPPPDEHGGHHAPPARGGGTQYQPDAPVDREAEEPTMTAVRRNILQDASGRDADIEGLRRLKAETLDDPLSTYDFFVIWHHQAMMILTPVTQGRRNAAHVGPVFLPWHRFFLIVLEEQLQRVLGNPDFGLPYWAWHVDGDKTPDEQRASVNLGTGLHGGRR